MYLHLQKNLSIGIGLSVLCFCFLSDLHSQSRVRSRTRNQADLLQFSKEKHNAWNRNYQKAWKLSGELKFPVTYIDERGRMVMLQRLGYQNRPVYYTTDNLDAAKIISANQLWTGEDEQPWLTGEGMEVNLWDGGAVLETHQEFQNSAEPRIEMRNKDISVSNHSTHVAGTIGAAGINELAKGMAGMVSVFGWDYNNDIAEMAGMASEGILISNHSYGSICGWDYNSTNEMWYWYGDPDLSADEDYQFGFYDQVSEDLDFIAWNAPDYLIVKSAGNDRQDAPPDQPIDHYIWDDGWTPVSVERLPDGGEDGYDCLSPMSVSKNILTVGAVDDTRLIASFSAFGPTDDGRIKPDVVASGTDVYSSVGTSFNSYGTYNGTSMSAASVTGSIALLHQLQEEHQPGVALRSSTLKGLLIHTADEMGDSPGPDYQHGWGILNIKEAAELIQLNAGSGGHVIREGLIAEGETLIIPIEKTIPVADLKITLCWTDPPGTSTAPVLNSRESKLVNDLDLELIEVGSQQSYFPWKLDPDSPDAPAVQGVNHQDNVEQVLLTDSPIGIYHVKIGRSGILSGGSQYYSLLISGSSSPSDMFPPRNLQFLTGESSVELNWDSPESGSPDYYRIYRNDLLLDLSIDTFYVDLDAETNSVYEYYITSIYDVNGTEYESLGSNKINAHPRTFRSLPFIVDFEDGYDEILIQNKSDGWLWGDSDSLSCYYLHFEENTTSFIAANSYSYGEISHVSDIAATMPLKLAGCTDVSVSFDYLFNTGIYDAIDVLYVMYKLPGEVDWQELEQLPRVLDWTTHSLSVPEEICKDGTQIGFYYDDLYQWGLGAGLDNISILGTETRSVDLGIISMLSPVSACTLTENETVKISIRNEGDTEALPGDRLVLQMNVSSGIQAEEVLVLTESLLSNETIVYEWTTKLDLSELGSYNFEFLLTSDLDHNTINNLHQSTVEVSGPVIASILNQDLSFCESDDPVMIMVDPAGGMLSGPGVSGLYFNPGIAGEGTHLITYTISDQLGCQGSVSTELVVSPDPQPAVLNQDLSFCEDDEPVLINVDPAGGTLSGPGVSGLYFDPEIAGVGTHLINYTYTASSGCTGAVSVEVVVSPTPLPVIIPAGHRFCKNDHPVLIEVSPEGGTLTGPGITDLIFNPKVAGTGVHICTYWYTDPSGCSGSVSTSLQVFENPWIDLGSDRQVGLDDTIELEPMGNGTFFLWYNGSTSSSLSIITSELGVGEHDIWVEASNLENCKGVDSMLLTIHTNTDGTFTRNPAEVYIYPNPCKSGFYLKGVEDEQIENIALLGSTGQMMMNKIPSTFPYIDVSVLPDGLYILKVRTHTYQGIIEIIKIQ